MLFPFALLHYFKKGNYVIQKSFLFSLLWYPRHDSLIAASRMRWDIKNCVLFGRRIGRKARLLTGSYRPKHSFTAESISLIRSYSAGLATAGRPVTGAPRRHSSSNRIICHHWQCIPSHLGTPGGEYILVILAVSDLFRGHCFKAHAHYGNVLELRFYDREPARTLINCNSTSFVGSAFSETNSANVLNGSKANEVYAHNRTVVLVTGDSFLPKLLNDTLDYGSCHNGSNWSNVTDCDGNYTVTPFENDDALHLAAMVATAFVLGLIILATVIGKSAFPISSQFPSATWLSPA